MPIELNLRNLREMATISRDAALADAAQETLDTHNASEKADIALAQVYPTAETFIELLDRLSEAHNAMREVTLSIGWRALPRYIRDKIAIALLFSRDA